MTADPLSVPRLTPPGPGARIRRVSEIVTAIVTLEGAGFQVRRPFPSPYLRHADPFVLLDHLGAVEYGPGEAKGAPDHPHRGFETVTYMIDGAIEHRDSTGGGGLITDGDTQWMTAGAGIVHSELPPEYIVRSGGLFHGVQLWVNLPRARKWVPPRYQDLRGERLTLLASPDGGALVRLITGELGGHRGPGATHTPIVYVHATVSPGAQLEIAWPADFNALVYVLTGAGTVGRERLPLREGQLAVLGPGEVVTAQAATHLPAHTPTLELLLLGGRPLREPVVAYGPFVMNTRDEILQAIEDYRAGRMGHIPPAVA